MKTSIQNQIPSARRRAVHFLDAIILASLLASQVSNAAPGDVDPTFNPGSAINDRVDALARQSDGKWIIVGAFTAVQGAARGRVARLNADGSTDHSFMAGLAGADVWVHSVAVQSDGKVVIGGVFSKVNGTARKKIARLNPDGTLDPTFGNGLTGVDSIFAYVNAISVQADGKILIGGNFSSVNGVARNNIARLNADGTVDATFANGLAGPAQEVSSIVLQADGKILISGYFNAVNGITRGRIARLNANGSLDTTFGNGLAGADAVVFSIAIQTDGKMVIGGAFNSVNGTARTGIARLNANGSLDTAFGNGLAGAYFLRSVALQSDGKVVIGGDFTLVNGVARTNIARLNSNGTLDSSFGNGPSGADEVVRCLAAPAGGPIVVGGDFMSVNAIFRSRLAGLGEDGTVDPQFDNGQEGPNGYILSLAAQADGKVLIGGVFTAVNGQRHNRIARLNQDGSLDTGFGSGLSGANDSILSVALQADGKVLVGGTFTNIHGAARNRVARLNSDGTLDAAFGNGWPGVAGANWDWGIISIAVQGDGRIVLGGYDIPVSETRATGITRLQPNGSFDATFGNGLEGTDGWVYSVALQSDGKILIGGQFGFVNGIARGSIARLNTDGTLDTTFGNGLSGVDISLNRADIVLALLQQKDGKILVGGDFAFINGVLRSGLARLNADGTLDTSFGDGLPGLGVFYGNDRARFFHEQTDGKILVGGFFTSINGVARGGIARLHSDGTPDTAFGDGMAGANSSVRAAALQPDGKLVIGGEFTAVNGIAGNGVARLHTEFLPPRLSLSVEGGLPALQIMGETGRQYVLEYVAELAAGNQWTALPAFTLTNSPQAIVDTAAAMGSRRFYRARMVP